VEAEKQPLLSNSSVTHTNRVSVGSCVFYVVCADTVGRGVLFEVRAEFV
jgi:hypothetical protein